VTDNCYRREISCNKSTWKSEWIVDTCCTVRNAHNSICTVCDNADRIKAL